MVANAPRSSRWWVSGVSGQFTDTKSLPASSSASGTTVTPISAAAATDWGDGSDPTTRMPAVSARAATALRRGDVLAAASAVPAVLPAGVAAPTMAMTQADAATTVLPSGPGFDTTLLGTAGAPGATAATTLAPAAPVAAPVQAAAPAPAPAPRARTADLSRITTVHPRTYNEARTIGEHFRDGVPVIMNLSELADADAKRLVDFAAGLIFSVHGTIERVTSKVFLLTPPNVAVAAEDKQRLAEGGFFNQS